MEEIKREKSKRKQLELELQKLKIKKIEQEYFKSKLDMRKKINHYKKIYEI